jgi:hypothetical protein
VSQARTVPWKNERGMYLTYCRPCDAEAEFPDIAMAIAARKEHLCDGEVASCATGPIERTVEP